MQEDIRTLQEDNRALNKEIKGLNEKVNGLERDISAVLGKDKTRRTRLLGGQIAYCFLERLSANVLGGTVQVSSVQDIRDQASTEQLDRLDLLLEENELTDDDCLEEVLLHMKQERFSDAHPTRMTQAEEDDPTSSEPTPAMLEEVINATFRNRAATSRKKKTVGISVVNLLGKLSMEQQKEILEL